MDFFYEIITNATMQSLLWSPLMGVIIGLLFSGLIKSPTYETPTTVVQTQHMYITHISSKGYTQGEDNEMGGIFAFFSLGLIFIVWQYAIHANMIHDYIAIFIFTVMSFSLTTMFIGLIKGQFTDYGWWYYVLPPFIMLGVTIYLLLLAKSAFTPEITEIAISQSFLSFYISGLSEYGQIFMITHVMGIILLCTSIILISGVQLHYLSLMNQRTDGIFQKFWFYLTCKTSFFSKKLWIYIAICLLISYIFLSPKLAAMWLLHWFETSSV